jgi:hypothetical protein
LKSNFDFIEKGGVFGWKGDGILTISDLDDIFMVKGLLKEI